MICSTCELCCYFRGIGDGVCPFDKEENNNKLMTMTEEDKKLLLRELSARLTYGVMCFAPDYEYGDIGKLWCIEPFEDLDPPIIVQYPKGNTITKFCSEVKPYLRPMSSMTEEELKELSKIKDNFVSCADHYYCELSIDSMDWLYSHHFDFRGLIEKGLALEAPEDIMGNDPICMF